MEYSKVKGFLFGAILLLLTATAANSQAQTFAEWFQQSKTQIKYLEQQIVALNACEVQFRQGYTMLKNEWGSIKNWKNSEYNLHSTYYNSLSQINPQVKNSTDLSGIQSEQQSIVSQFNDLNGLAGLTAQEQTYIGTVQQNLLAELNKDLTELQTILTPGGLVMSDDERIKRINRVTSAINDKYLFTCAFCRHVRVLVIQRNRDGNDAAEIGNLYGINP
ncbi:hypothetical protein JN11_03418 [Mucilaginibacter frigoritolerans]|uniref:Uncharacterized protein n=1 Tax=Mucilaginibacter frigoritolerans TaxID=652788 RepID=A0A562TWX2_9SPHI|nr:hypothetical protein [Mucilaginibacter frigoritolerans]TWI97596.1 hypothetical protein JN11_03418 [Mucilaginibacter frigoritolerans]